MATPSAPPVIHAGSGESLFVDLMELEQHARRRKLIGIGVGIGMALGIVIFFAVLSSDTVNADLEDSQPKTIDPDALDAPPPALARSSSEITSSPAGARVIVNGILQDRRTPDVFSLISGEKNDVLLILDGHAPARALFAPGSSDGPLSVTLEPLRGPAKTDGTLLIDATPEGAEILIDGKTRGTSPLTLEGLDHRIPMHIEVRAEAHVPISGVVCASTQKEDSVALALKQKGASTSALLDVQSYPFGAAVELDGGPGGTTPSVRYRDLNQLIRVELQLDGYEPHTALLETRRGHHVLMRPRLERAERVLGSLQFTGVPAGAKLYVGSEQVDPRNRLRLDAGRHTVVLEVDSGRRYESTVEVPKKSMARYSVKLTPDEGLVLTPR